MLVLFKLLGLVAAIKLSRSFGFQPIATLCVCLVIGHILDRAVFSRYQKWRWGKRYSKAAKKQMDEAFLVSTFNMFAKLCMADGAVKP